MNRRLFISTSMLVGALVTLPVTLVRAVAGKIGKMTPKELETVTKEGGAKVKAIKATAEPLSKADEKLMMEVAMGGMMQLEISRVALKMATSPEVKDYAKAEVEEQTVLSAKLKEVAAAKKIALPEKMDEKTEKEVAKLSAMQGAAFDKAYLKEGGVAGHKLLKATMTKVESKAQDATLKSIAATALPLINTHLQVAQDEESAMA